MTEEQKAMIADFVNSEIERIRFDRQTFQIDVLRADANELYNKLISINVKPATACQHVEDALRYINHFLADFALHTHARSVGKLLNDYRTKGRKHLGLRKSYYRKKVQALVTGYLYGPKRVVVAAFVLWLGFSIVYGIFFWVTDKPAIVYADGQPVPWFYYPYFSLVTLATLGYGDIAPNTQGDLGWIPAYFACLEAVCGYAILGLFVSMMVLNMYIHPYIRISKWHEEYDDYVLRRSQEPLFIDGKWPGYDK